MCLTILIRGLGALIRAIMLEHFTEFLENSAMSLYVAMEASMEIVKETLCAEGNENPTARPKFPLFLTPFSV